MAFDNKAFVKAKFEPRQESLAVPALKAFFGEDEKPEFLIRGLDVYEFAAVKEAKIKNKNIDNLIKILTNDATQVEALRNAVGIASDDIPGELAGRIEAFKLGLVEPTFDQQTTVIFAKRFPIDFWAITQRIFELTGMGMEVKKQQPSGVTE